MIMSDFDKKYRDILFDTLKFTIDFLHKNNLNYYVAYGTAIGAVRHHNMIPWDDDVDIYMPRKDYETLIMLSTKLRNSNYHFVSLETEKSYYLPFGKIFDKRTTILEYEQFVYVVGVYIDIFPLDYTDESIDIIKKHLSDRRKEIIRFQECISEYTVDYFKRTVRDLHPFRFLIGMKKLFFRNSKEDMLNKVIGVDTIFNSERGKYIVSSADFVSPNNIYLSEWFKKTCEMPFGNMKVLLPDNYDLYLRSIYGDYMTLPPKEQRVHKHPHFYINLSERLNLKEVRKRVRNSEFRHM